MNTQHELATLGMQMRDLARRMADDKGEPRNAVRLLVMAERLAEIAEAARPDRKPVRGPRRWWRMLTRRAIA